MRYTAHSVIIHFGQIALLELNIRLQLKICTTLWSTVATFNNTLKLNLGVFLIYINTWYKNINTFQLVIWQMQNAILLPLIQNLFGHFLHLFFFFFSMLNIFYSTVIFVDFSLNVLRISWTVWHWGNFFNFGLLQGVSLLWITIILSLFWHN